MLSMVACFYLDIFWVKSPIEAMVLFNKSILLENLQEWPNKYFHMILFFNFGDLPELI